MADSFGPKLGRSLGPVVSPESKIVAMKLNYSKSVCWLWLKMLIVIIILRQRVWFIKSIPIFICIVIVKCLYVFAENA